MPEFMWYIVGGVVAAFGLYFVMIVLLVLRLALRKDK